VQSERLGAINDAVSGFYTAAVTSVVALFYIGITAVSTTHTQLLLGHDLRLPLLDVEVPVFQFFRLAPLIVVAFHLLLLLQVHILHTRLRSISTQDLPALSPSVVVSALLRLEQRPWVRRLLRLLLLTLIFLFPLALLAAIQFEFVPYHNRWITLLFYQVPIVMDLVVCVVLVPVVLSQEGGWLEWWRRPRQSRQKERLAWTFFAMARLFFALIVGGALIFSLGVAVVPGTCTDLEWAIPTWLANRRNLDVSGEQLVDAERATTWLAAHASGRKTRTLDLTGRDLRDAGFLGSGLVGVDFRGADLARARFTGADLRGSDFSPAGPGGAGTPGLRTNLEKANFNAADLRGARLVHAQLRRADLAGTDLRGATLTGADLRLGRLKSTRLQGADLSYAQLEGAILDNAFLTCGSLYAADAAALSASDLEAGVADLRRAQLQGATFVGANLDAALFSGADTLGGDFRRASFAASRGLAVSALDLRGADLSAALVGAVRERAPRFSDLRGAVYDGDVTALLAEVERELKPSEAALRGFPEGRKRLAKCQNRVRQLRKANPHTTVASAVAEDEARGLLPVGQAMDRARGRKNLTDRGDSAVLSADGENAENRFHRGLIEALLSPETGCTLRPLAATLVLLACGCDPPRDPILELPLQLRLRELLDAPESCPALESLRGVIESHTRLDENALREWDAAPEFPRWQAPVADCVGLRRDLLEGATEGPRVQRAAPEPPSW